MKTDTPLGYLPSNVMRDLLRDNPMLLPAISRFDIAFGFGDDSVVKVCAANKVDLSTFLCVCNLLSGYPYNPEGVSLESLMGYLKRAHTSFLEVELPKIRHYLLDAINHTGADRVNMLLIKFFDDYVVEVRKHMEHENNVIFEYVNCLLNGIIASDFNISMYSESHKDTVEKLNELKDIFIYHYRQNDSIRLSSTLLDIVICERDMLSHFEVESKLFVPLVVKLEKDLKSKLTLTGSHDETEATDPAMESAALSEREKDIIRAIAHGKVNKEIADELCISVHTVATHRRNISAKLDIHSAAGLTIYAIINNLVDINDVKPS